MHLQLKHALLDLLEPVDTPITVSTDSLCKHIQSLKNNKAPDPHGVSAEHLKLADTVLIPILTFTLIEILKKAEIPEMLKLGLVTPVLKKQKQASNPDNYRRITINSMFGKLIEKVMLPISHSALDPSSSTSQFGFKKSVSCINAAVIVT